MAKVHVYSMYGVPIGLYRKSTPQLLGALTVGTLIKGALEGACGAHALCIDTPNAVGL